MNKTDAARLRDLVERELDDDPRLVGTALAMHENGWCVRVFIDDSPQLPRALRRLESTRPDDVKVVRAAAPRLD